MDQLRIDGMSFYGTHGVLPEENRLGQRFYVDMVLYLDIREAARKDHMEDSVNYALVYDVVKREVEETEVRLIETLAENIAKQILTQFSVHQVKVKVIKPNPPIKEFHGSVSIEIVRKRGSM